MSVIRRLFGCRHAWQNTGIQMAITTGVSLNLFECSKCGEHILVQT